MAFSGSPYNQLLELAKGIAALLGMGSNNNHLLLLELDALYIYLESLEETTVLHHPAPESSHSLGTYL